MKEPNFLLESLFAPWWVWNSAEASFGDYLYRGFNLFEAGAWFVFAFLVLHRWRRRRNSALEVAYAGCFVAFGLTDVAEAWRQSLPLLMLKGVVLAALLMLRAKVRGSWYPNSRVF